MANGPRPCCASTARPRHRLGRHRPDHARSEHQRWGLAGDPQPLIGRDYIQAVILQQLAQIGVRTARPRLRAILERLPAAPLRYYGDWDRLPPDCDSLGLFLTLATQLGGVAPAKVAAWLSVLRPSLREDGHIPTWLIQGLDGPTTPEPRWSWAGRLHRQRHGRAGPISWTACPGRCHRGQLARSATPTPGHR